MFEIQLKFSNLFFLIYFITFVFLAALFVKLRVGDFNTFLFYVFGGEIPSRISQGDLWLLVTANFFHLDIVHYIFNVVSLKRIGDLVENFYEGRILFTVFIFSGIGGTLLTYFVSQSSTSEIYSLGASAGVFGLVGLLLGGTLKRYRYGIELPFSLADILPFVLFALMFGFLPGSNINNWAHLGGLAVGVLFGLVYSNTYNREGRVAQIVRDVKYYMSIAVFSISYLFLIINIINLLNA